MKNLALLILAAGTSSRMEEPKQLLPFQASTLLGTVIQNCLATKIDHIYCVLGANATEIEVTHQYPKVQFIRNPDYKQGLSSSIKSGVEYIVKKQSEVSGLLILLGDQPYITEQYINQYLRLHIQKPLEILATVYPKKIGVPAIFPYAHFTSLLALQGDAGARELLQQIHDNCLIKLPVGVLKDIDSQEDYLKSQKSNE